MRRTWRRRPDPTAGLIHLETAGIILGVSSWEVRGTAWSGLVRYAYVDGQMMVREDDVASLAHERALWQAAEARWRQAQGRVTPPDPATYVTIGAAAAATGLEMWQITTMIRRGLLHHLKDAEGEIWVERGAVRLMAKATNPGGDLPPHR